MYICESDKHSILQLGTLLPFAFFKHVFAEQPQFTLPAVPTSVCNGAAGSGVATFSSQWPAASVVEILDGGYTHQSGGQWKIWTDNKGIKLTKVGIPGAGAGPSNADQSGTKLENLIKIDPADNRSFKLNISDTNLWGNAERIILQAAAAPAPARARRNPVLEARASASSPNAAESILSEALCTFPGAKCATASATKAPTTLPKPVSSKASSKPITSSSKSVQSSGTVSALPAFTITATGTWQCSLGAGVGTLRPAGTPAASDVASRCEQNTIPKNTQALKDYNVDSYLKNLIETQVNSSGQPLLGVTGAPGLKSQKVDIGALLEKDGGFSDTCDLNKQCQIRDCRDFAETNVTGVVDALNPARYLSYMTFVNLSNFYQKLYDTINTVQIVTDPVIEKFLTVIPAKTLLSAITGVTAPAATVLGLILVFASTFLGPEVMIAGRLAAPLINRVGLGGLLSANGVSTIGGATAAKPNPTLEQGWTASGDLQLLLQNYVGNFSDSIEQAYKNGLQQTDEDDWVNVTNSGIGFNQLPHEADLASNLRDNLTALFYMKAMNYAFTADDAFILWMPFGAPLNIYNQWSDVPNPFLSNPKITAKPSKKFPNFSMKDCTDNFQKGDNGSVFTVCGAGSKTPGMARIYQLSDKIKPNTYRSALTGWDADFQVTKDWKFDLPTVIKGSVNSWQTGGFDFNLDNVTGNAFTDLVENFKVNPLTPGVFTIPICAPGVRVYDTTSGRFNSMAPFPDASKNPVSFSQGNKEFAQCNSGGLYKVAPDQQREPNAVLYHVSKELAGYFTP